MKEYVIAGGLNTDALEKNINFYAKEGFIVIPPIKDLNHKGYSGYWVLMERDHTSGEDRQ